MTLVRPRRCSLAVAYTHHLHQRGLNASSVQRPEELSSPVKQTKKHNTTGTTRVRTWVMGRRETRTCTGTGTSLPRSKSQVINHYTIVPSPAPQPANPSGLHQPLFPLPVLRITMCNPIPQLSTVLCTNPYICYCYLKVLAHRTIDSYWGANRRMYH